MERNQPEDVSSKRPRSIGNPEPMIPRNADQSFIHYLSEIGCIVVDMEVQAEDRSPTSCDKRHNLRNCPEITSKNSDTPDSAGADPVEVLRSNFSTSLRVSGNGEVIKGQSLNNANESGCADTAQIIKQYLEASDLSTEKQSELFNKIMTEAYLLRDALANLSPAKRADIMKMVIETSGPEELLSEMRQYFSMSA